MMFTSEYNANTQIISVKVEVSLAMLEVLKAWYVTNSPGWKSDFESSVGEHVMASVMDEYREINEHS